MTLLLHVFLGIASAEVHASESQRTQSTEVAHDDWHCDDDCQAALLDPDPGYLALLQTKAVRVSTKGATQTKATPPRQRPAQLGSETQVTSGFVLAGNFNRILASERDTSLNEVALWGVVGCSLALLAVAALTLRRCSNRSAVAPEELLSKPKPFSEANSIAEPALTKPVESLDAEQLLSFIRLSAVDLPAATAPA